MISSFDEGAGGSMVSKMGSVVSAVVAGSLAVDGVSGALSTCRRILRSTSRCSYNGSHQCICQQYGAGA